MDHFSYHSEQVHSAFQNGKGQTRRNIVDIKNGKGNKAVETYDVNGKSISRKEKVLTASELECIQRNKFVPGLFKDCIKPLGMRSGATRSQASRTKPMRSQPMRSQPLRSQPMRSQPMRSKPMRSKPMRSGAKTRRRKHK